MAGTALESVLRRDRAVVAAALAAITVSSWAYILWLAWGMAGGGSSSMARPGMEPPGAAVRAAGMLAPALAPWSAGDALFVLIMWAVMMVGMMTPSAAPMILIYARVGRQAERQGKPFASTAWFAAGYLASWIGFACLAAAAQWGLERAALLTSGMAAASPLFGGVLLVVAGLYQWVPFKDACLSHCRSPFAFIQHHGGLRPDPRGALVLGLRHGAYCIGCCWMLMAILFVGGVMNVLWIAALAAFVLVEKVVPGGRTVSRVAGAVLVAWGAALLLG